MTAARHLLALIALSVSMAGGTAARSAAAQAGDIDESRLDSSVSSRPHGMAELGLGWLTLPGAQVCTRRDVDCEEGDSSPAIEVWQLYRASSQAAIGAGITLGLVPTNDAFGNQEQDIPRDHSRSYFAVEGIARYYPWAGPRSEAWLGLTGGLVVVSDSYSSSAAESDRALIGQSGATIRTEGYTIGLAAGGDYRFAENWSFGLHIRYGSWFLPETPARDVFGDEASLTGRTSMFAFVLALAYRIAL
jgi:hypothetical protein